MLFPFTSPDLTPFESMREAPTRKAKFYMQEAARYRSIYIYKYIYMYRYACCCQTARYIDMRVASTCDLGTWPQRVTFATTAGRAL